MERRRFAKRRALKLAGAAGASIAAIAALKRLEALSIPQPERYIGPHPDFAADVVVYRDGDEAVAVDSKGSKLCSSDDHWKVMDKVFDELESIGGGIIRVRGVIEIDQYLVPRRNLLLIGAGDYDEGADELGGDVIRAKSAMEALFITDEYVENFKIIGLGLDGKDLARRALYKTGGYRVILQGVEIARVKYAGVEATAGGGLFVDACRINVSQKSAESDTCGIIANTDNVIAFNTIRGFKTGVRTTSGNNFIAFNHPFPMWGYSMDIGLDVMGDIVIGNYIDDFFVYGIRTRGWAAKIIGNILTASAGAGTATAYIAVDADTPGATRADHIIVGNDGDARGSTTVQYAIYFTDNIADAYGIRATNNRWKKVGAITNDERFLASAPLKIPVLSDCANARNGTAKGELMVCYDTGAAKWVLKVWDGSAWQTIG